MSKASNQNLQDVIDSYDSLQKIVDQLEFAGYENAQSVLTHNVAFIKLKQFAEQETIQKTKLAS